MPKPFPPPIRPRFSSFPAISGHEPVAAAQSKLRKEAGKTGILFIRTVLLYVIMMAAMRLMGKRQVGELQPLELTVTIIISNIASLPLEHASYPLFNGLIPVLTLVALEVVMSVASLKWRRLRLMSEGRPVVVIYDGVIRQEQLRALRFSVDDLMEELRSAGVFDPAEVQVAVVETSGKLSVHLHPDHQPLTARTLAGLTIRPWGKGSEVTVSVRDGQDRSLHEPPPGPVAPEHAPPPPFVAVADGQLETQELARNRVPDRAVFSILAQEGTKLNQVLLLTMDSRRRYRLVKKEEEDA